MRSPGDLFWLLADDVDSLIAACPVAVEELLVHGVPPVPVGLRRPPGIIRVFITGRVPFAATTLRLVRLSPHGQLAARLANGTRFSGWARTIRWGGPVTERRGGVRDGTGAFGTDVAGVGFPVARFGEVRRNSSVGRGGVAPQACRLVSGRGVAAGSLRGGYGLAVAAQVVGVFLARPCLGVRLHAARCQWSARRHCAVRHVREHRRRRGVVLPRCPGSLTSNSLPGMVRAPVH